MWLAASSPWRASLLLFLCSATLKVLLSPWYHSTDLEVHRNWLALTHSLPFTEWYINETSEWTLDYPPLFALFEWTMSWVARVLVDPKMETLLLISSNPVSTSDVVWFQRCSVMAFDCLLWLGTTYLSLVLSNNKRDAATVVGVVCSCVFFNGGLLVVDHLHFQYNGGLLGILFLSVANIVQGNVYTGSFIFCLLLSMKHLFLCVAPVYFIFLLRWHCIGEWKTFSVISAVHRTTILGIVVTTTLVLPWLPFYLYGDVGAIFRRLFPFERGLTHSYWAPNLWAIYTFTDRVLCKFLQCQSHSSSPTAGLVAVIPMSVLPNISPNICVIAVLIAYVPLLLTILSSKKKNVTEFPLYVAIGSWLVFSLGYHVHEKAALIFSVLATVWGLSISNAKSSETRRSFLYISAVTNVAQLPLLSSSNEMALKWTLILFGWTVERVAIRQLENDSKPPPKEIPICVYGSLLLILIFDLISLFVELQFIPLMFTSVACAIMIFLLFTHFFLIKYCKKRKK